MKFQSLLFLKNCFAGKMIWGLLFVLFSITSFSNLSYTNTTKPNILIIIGDDISWNDLGSYGNDVVKTPNIDYLAQNGLRFDNAYLTISSCSPSRISIMTGRYPHNTGAPELHMPFSENQLPIPELLKASGYYTAAAGKWHMSGRAYHSPSGRIAAAFDRTGGSRFDDGGPGGEKRWVDWLQDRPKEKSFFMWFASHDAHRGWSDTEVGKSHDPGKITPPPYLADMQNTRKEMAAYYEEVSRLDYYTGQVIEELKKQGVLNNTLIIFMADNGRPFPRCKTRLYDCGIKTPFIIHWPDKIENGGETVDGLISVVDLAPTILDVTDIDIPAAVQGISFEDMIEDKTEKVRDYVFAEHNWHDDAAHERMVRYKDYVYIRNLCPQCNRTFLDFPSRNDLEILKEEGELTKAQRNIFINPAPTEELYDLSSDPYQIRNLAGKKEYSEELNHLREVLDRWIEKTGDTRPEKLTPDTRDEEGDEITKWIVDTNVIYPPGDKRGKRKDNEKSKMATPVMRGQVAGSSTDASEINSKGPVLKPKE